MSFDLLGNSTHLRNSIIKREIFDPENKDHQLSLSNFLQKGNWGNTQFYIESPFSTVPETVLRKTAKHFIETKLKSVSSV